MDADVSPGPRRMKPETGPKAPDEALGRALRSALRDVIGEQVVHRLGTPGDLLMLQVRPIVGNHYRVNVVVGKQITASRIAHSFFLLVDADGNIVNSCPNIARRY
jgi:hypothetical protein